MCITRAYTHTRASKTHTKRGDVHIAVRISFEIGNLRRPSSDKRSSFDPCNNLIRYIDRLIVVWSKRLDQNRNIIIFICYLRVLCTGNNDVTSRKLYLTRLLSCLRYNVSNRRSQQVSQTPAHCGVSIIVNKRVFLKKNFRQYSTQFANNTYISTNFILYQLINLKIKNANVY